LEADTFERSTVRGNDVSVQTGLIRNAREAVALSLQIFSRTIGAKYRKSFLGYFWMIVPVVVIGGGVSVAKLAGTINPGVTGLPYTLFVFIGVVIWMIFVELLDVPYAAFENARSYLTRVNFPREAIVLVQVYESLVGAAARYVFVCAIIAAYGLFSVGGALILLASLMTAILLGLGTGMLLAPFMILFEDLRNTIRIFVSYGIFVSAAFYAPHSGVFGRVIQINPLSIVMGAAREGVETGGLTLVMPSFLIVVLVSVLLVVTGAILIRIALPIVVERMLIGGR
jgi:lipopolysaccharide transport system permease protein